MVTSQSTTRLAGPWSATVKLRPGSSGCITCPVTIEGECRLSPGDGGNQPSMVGGVPASEPDSAPVQARSETPSHFSLCARWRANCLFDRTERCGSVWNLCTGNCGEAVAIVLTPGSIRAAV